MKNKLHTIFILTVLVNIASPLCGQQMPWFSAYSFQPKFINPAAQGGPSGGNVGVAYRSQFSDLPSASRPVTYLFHLDVSPFISDRIGLGLLAMQDEVHLTKRTNVTGFFGYHLFPEESDFRLSLGAMAGILNQRMELGTATVNNPFDLTLMKGTETKLQFDGGAGLQAQFAGLQLDLTLPQLFTSDIEYTPAEETRNIRYDIFPHLLSSLRYRWEGDGFAIEPNLVYREVFGKKLKAANFDFGLRGYFLDNDMVMVGAGYRTDEGGLQFSAGVKPIPKLLIFGAYETHSALGGTFEAGVQYKLGGRDTSTHSPRTSRYDQLAAVQLTQDKNTAEAARQKAVKTAVTAREKIEIARFSLNEAKNTSDHKTRQAKLANADKYFPEIEGLATNTSAEAKKATDAHRQATDLLKQAKASGKKVRNEKVEMPALETAYLEAKRSENDVTAKFKEIKDLRASIKPLLNVNDPATIQNYLSTDLASLANRPDETKVLQVSATSIEIQYADAEESYQVSAGAGKAKSLADWLGLRIAELKDEGIQVESLRLSADLLNSNVDSRVDAKYASDYGATFKTPYKLNGKDKTSSIKKDAAITRETLAVLKLYDMKRYLAGKLGVPEDKITIEVTAPNSKNEYQQITRVMVNYRK